MPVLAIQTSSCKPVMCIQTLCGVQGTRRVEVQCLPYAPCLRHPLGICHFLSSSCRQFGAGSSLRLHDFPCTIPHALRVYGSNYTFMRDALAAWPGVLQPGHARRPELAAHAADRKVPPAGLAKGGGPREDARRRQDVCKGDTAHVVSGNARARRSKSWQDGSSREPRVCPHRIPETMLMFSWQDLT